jgi:hypothetical protein
MDRFSRHAITVAALAASCAIALPGAARAQAPIACDQVVTSSFDGVDDALSPGQTVCVRGTVASDIWIDTPGVTLTSEPGQTGTIRGQVVVGPAASGVTVSDLNLDGSGLTYPGQIILGDDATFARNDITNRRSPAICLIIGALGHDSGAEARNARIVGNKIHDCGVGDNHQHGMYVEHADGTQIIGNDIYDNADRAIQLYPHAMNSVVAGNVIDGNGEGVIFGGTGSSSSSGNVVRNNVISNPRLRAGIESWWDDAQPGTGNVAKDNCVYGAERMVDTEGGGFTADNNLELDPLFTNRGAKDFSLRDGSPCLAILAAGRSGTTARLAAPRSAALAPATVQVSDPLKVAVKRDGGTVRVTVKLTKKPTARSFARVEIRQGGGRWKSIGVRAISAQRSITFRTTVARNRKLTVRATLLGSAKKTFRS